MGRYRPPQPPSSPYITRQGYERLDRELKDIWQRRAEVTRAVAAAAAEGDRSENAEYIYRKKELREIDRRIRYLQKRLPTLKVVDQPPSNPQQVFFGAWVTVEDESGCNHCYRIVGADEIDSAAGCISIDAPMARSLLKKTIDDEVVVRTAERETRYLVVSISYRQPDDASAASDD